MKRAMTSNPTLVIRGGTIADGLGGDLFEADVAISDGRIIEVGRVTAKGDEEIDIPNLDKITPKCPIEIVVRKAGGVQKIKAQVRIDTPNELKYFRSGGILPFVLERLAARG